MKEKIEKIDKLMLLLTEMRKQIQELQDKQAAEEKLYTWSIDFILFVRYEDYLSKHNNISDKINMLLKTYALISNEMSKVCLNLI